MKIDLKRVTLIVLAIMCIMIYFIRYPLLYKYYMWKLDYTSNGSEIEDINNDIRAIGQHVVSLLENTYKDINKSDKNRSAAAWAIINVDKNRAEILFLPYLHGQKDDTIVVRAIYDLGRNGSVNALPAIEK